MGDEEDYCITNHGGAGEGYLKNADSEHVPSQRCLHHRPTVDAVDQFAEGIVNEAITTITARNQNAAYEYEGHTISPDKIASKGKLFTLI